MTLRWYGDKAKAAIRQGAEEGIRAIGEAVFEASQLQVPEDTSGLKESGELKVDEAALTAKIRYGQGLPDPRAVIAHEKLEIQHDVGSAKYLENPLNEQAGKAAQLLAGDIRKNLG